MFGFHPQLSSAALSHLLSGLPNANAASAPASGSSTPGVGHGAAADGLPAGSFAAHARSLSLAALNAKAGGVHHSHSHPPQHPHPHRGLSGSRSDSDPPQGTGTAPSSGRAPSHRSRNGCYTCRRRKVKCDERTPVCIKCEYSDRKCEWPPDDPLIRRKNRPRKMKLHLSEQEQHKAQTPLALDETAQRKMRVPLEALQAFAATLPPGKEIKGYNKGFSDSLMPPTLRASMMMDSAFLAPYFPSVDERLIFRHYISRTVHLSIAFDDPKSTWNPWLNLIAPLAFTHLPGVSSAADALRAALLTIGSVHLHYIANPSDQAGASRIMRLAHPTVLGLVRTAFEGQEGKEVDKQEVELILAALLGSIIASSLAADDGWHPLLESVIEFVTQMGGTQGLLRDAPRDHLSPARFVLEQLAIRDVFGCMTTESPPSILRDAFTPWFFEAESWSRTDPEWESVERMFGISRGMVDLMARTCTLVSQVRKAGRSLHPDSSPPSTPMGDYPPRVQLEEEAEGLMAELKVWDEACNFTPYHPRTQYGNIAHRHAMTIKLLRDVFNVPREDERVYASATAILELAVEMVVQYGTMVWLTWPVVIAAFQLPKGDELRGVVRNLVSNPGPHSCFDMGAAKSVVEACWEYHDGDAHHSRAWELSNRPFFD